MSLATAKVARTRTVAGELFIAGAFSAAMQVLTFLRRVKDFAQLKYLFM
jgi:hypothetical protein